MVQVLTTGDENTGQPMSIPVPGRSSPLVVRPVPGTSIGGAPWGSATFLDPQTTLAVASQTGSPATPYGTAQRAADNTDPGNAIVMGPGDAGSVVVVQRAFTWFGFGLLDETFQASERPRVGNFTFTDPSASNLAQRFVNINVTGTINLNGDGYLAGDGCEFGDAISGVLLSEFTDSSFQGAVAADQVTATGCFFRSTVSATFANFETCQTDADVTASIACQFLNHTFTAGITVTSPSIQVDAYSMATAITAGVTFTSTPRILDAFAAAEFYQTTLGGVAVNTSPDNNMHVIGSANYGTSAPSPVWTGGADCVATYSGPGGHRFRVTVRVSSRATVVATFAYFSGAVDIDGDTIGDASFSNLANGEQQVQDAAVGSVTQHATFERIVTPANGSTVQPTFGVGAGSEAVDLDLATLTMTIEGVP